MYHRGSLSPPAANRVITQDNVFNNHDLYWRSAQQYPVSTMQRCYCAIVSVVFLCFFSIQPCLPSKFSKPTSESELLMCPNSINTLLLMVGIIGMRLVVYSRSSMIDEPMIYHEYHSGLLWKEKMALHCNCKCILILTLCELIN